MRRAPIVIAATAAGLAGVLGFHTQKISTRLVIPSGSTASGGTGSSSGGTGSSSAGVPSSPTTTAPGSSASSSSGTTTTAPGATGTRSALGADVQYFYGELQLKVTVSGTKITSIQPVIDNAADPRSAQINSISEPQLEQQALQAQSANIQGVSGATYTSQAYVQSLQAALDKLGIK